MSNDICCIYSTPITYVVFIILQSHVLYCPTIIQLHVLTMYHYFVHISGRIGDIPEDDVYVCESKYQEPENNIKKLGKGLKVRFY